MNLIPDRKTFWRQLAAWSVRGVICATPSFILAVRDGYDETPELCAMVLGVITFVLAYSWSTSLSLFRDSVESTSLGSAFRFAASARTASAAMASLVLVLRDIRLGVEFLLMPDLVAGMISSSVMEAVGKALAMTVGGEANSFIV